MKISAILACSLSVFAALALGYHGFFDPFGRDQGIHATIAFALNEGLLPYRDVYNIKPPLTTVVHWAALEIFGHSVASIRIFDFLLAVLASWAFIALLRQFGRSYATGLAAAIAFFGLYYSLSYWNRAQTDGWATMFCLASLLPLVHAWQLDRGARRFRYIAFAGALLAIAFAFKYTIALMGLVIFVPAMSGHRRNFFWLDLVWYVTGGLATLFAIALIMAGSGVLGPFLEIQQYILGYVGALDPQKDVSEVPLAEKFTKIFRGAVLAAVPFLAGFSLLFLDLLRKKSVELHVVILISLLAATASTVSQGKYFTYHYLPFLLPLPVFIALSADALIDVLNRATRNNFTGTTTVLVLAALVLLPFQTALNKSLTHLSIELNGGSDREHWALHGMPADFNFPETVAAAEAIDRISDPDDRMFVWGYETLLYFLLETPPMYRYPYAWPLVVSFHDGRYTDDLVSRLEAAPPEIFVVQYNDETPHVTGHDYDSRAMLVEIPELSGFLWRNYSKVDVVPRYEIWKRNE